MVGKLGAQMQTLLAASQQQQVSLSLSRARARSLSLRVRSLSLRPCLRACRACFPPPFSPSLTALSVPPGGGAARCGRSGQSDRKVTRTPEQNRDRDRDRQRQRETEGPPNPGAERPQTATSAPAGLRGCKDPLSRSAAGLGWPGCGDRRPAAATERGAEGKRESGQRRTKSPDAARADKTERTQRGTERAMERIQNVRLLP